ncbi:oxidoreductase [Knoellia subterranea KCTC 19937]|uniref:Oxidoreductase n=2 Tax=Knoellia TaxID=136099 RepID=A0A0A0JMK1_9MICO|nr:oxidoreductase [Knoellia subterranea KCTC 19937]
MEHPMTDTTSPSRTEPETGGTGPGFRSVTLSRTAHGEFDVTNIRGGTIHIGTGDTDDFTPVELLLTAIAGCSAVDVDFITAKRAEPSEFTVESTGVKAKSAEKGNHMEDLEVTFRVRFPEGPEGDRAREMLPRAIAQSHDRLCSVSRTVQLGTPVTMRED